MASIGYIMKDFLFNGNPQQETNSSSKKGKNPERFSFKSGITFFLKSNLVLLIVLLFFFINKASWSEQGGSVVLLFTLVWEFGILLCSSLTCFKKKEHSPVAKKVKST